MSFILRPAHVPSPSSPQAPDCAFADPDWRGDQRAPACDPAPTASLVAEARRLEDWIRGGACYGWLDTYQARRAAFELQSIRAQLTRLTADDGRCAIQSRLERLDRMLRAARGEAWSGPGHL